MNIVEVYCAEIIIKKSKFIAILSPCKNEDELKKQIKEARENNPKARHVVHAAVWGDNCDRFSLSDDKEPKFTAGKPILNTLLGSKITNASLLVVRYFGGTLLGRGGLVHAYKDVASLVIQKALEHK